MMNHTQASLEGAGATSTRVSTSFYPASPCPSCKGLWEEQREYNLTVARQLTETLHKLLEQEEIIKTHTLLIRRLEDGV